jgi:hypothetical protein
MADLSITAANVKAGGTSCIPTLVQFGETMTAGQSAYLNSADGKYYKADADAAGKQAGTAVVLVGAAGDAYGVIANGYVIIGATVTNGMAYIVSATAGGIAPVGDFSGYSGATQQHLGYGVGTTILDVRPYATGATN